MRPAWRADTARKLGLSGEIDFTVTRIGQTLHVPCEKGKHVVDVPISAGLHPNGVAKNMILKGWTVGRRLVCPDCKPHKRERATPMTQGTTHTAQQQPTATPSDAAKRAHRLLFMALEDYYDEASKRYKPGYSDAKIAEETGAAEAHVRKTREEFFGPLGQPPELEAMKVELSALTSSIEKTIAQFREQLANAKSRLARICQINGWPVE